MFRSTEEPIKTHSNPLDHEYVDASRSFQEPTSVYSHAGRYMSRGPDRHPNIPVSQVLMFPSSRPGRLAARKSGDPAANNTYGDAIVYKEPGSTRFFFQNVKGLTHSQSKEDYKYFLSTMTSYSVDVFGMAETNTGWQHKHLQMDFQACVRRQFTYGKTVFGYPAEHIDPLPPSETFQAGGTIQVTQGNITTTVSGDPILDPSGLGRWCGTTFLGKGNNKFTVLSCYRSCGGSINTAPLGSTYHREYTHFKEQGAKNPNPRFWFFSDLSNTLRQLQNSDHAVMIMLDANASIDKDRSFRDFVDSHDLQDLHINDPAPSTYIGASNRRIDYILGCPRTRSALTRQGTLSYFEGPQSDHRGLFVDINLKDIFGISPDSTLLPSAVRRHLRSGNPELTERYLSAMRNYYNNHKMKERIDELYISHKNMTRSQVRKRLIAWDNDQGRAMASSEASLAVSPKPYKWSPRLRNEGVIMRYWKLRLREKKFSEDYHATFDRWEQKIQCCDPLFKLPEKDTPLDITNIRLRLNAAVRTFRSTQKKSDDIRASSHYELLAKYEADDSDSTKQESKRKQKIIRQTIQAEATRTLHSKIRSIVKPSEFAALSNIQIPRHRDDTESTQPGDVHKVLQTSSENLVWDTIINRQDIEDHLVQFNKEAFRAAAESPCGHGVIHDALRFTSLSPEAEELLRGEVPPEWYGDNNLLRDFLASFRIPDTVLSCEPISIKISEKDIIKGFKSWKESTTTSPSGRHLGHYKAIIQDPVLLTCFRKFLNIAISRGIAVPRWCKAVNVLIEKDKGRPRINRLRIIHLFEADYNFFLKLMWGSRLVKRALELDLLNPGQHGSVPGRTTIDPIMLNHLTTDLCRILKLNYVRFDNDASACYDRIIVSLGMMAARRCGMPINAVRSHAKSLELMQYTVKTVYGISNSSYQGTPIAPLFGTGQGSGASPAVWLTLVVILLNTLDRLTADRISFKSPDGKIQHCRLVDAFVDDTALGSTDNGSRSLEELVEALQTTAQTWEKLLHYSGGALNLSKCSWYAMVWDWKNGRPQMRQIQPDDPPIRLTQGSNPRPVEIKRQDLSTSSRILGVYQNPLGDFHDHVAVLKGKADQFSRYLKSPRLTPSDIRVFHKTVYGPAMRYSLPALALDEEELGSVQSKIIPTIVQRMGLSSKLPTAIRHGPISMGGLGLMDLRTEYGIEMINLFRHAVYCQTEVGKLLLIQVQTSQLEAGIPTPLLENPGLHLPYLTPNWVLSMRQFMYNHNITITLSSSPPLHMKLASPRDKFIMTPEGLSGYTTAQQQDINWVRIYLQVTTLSDLTDTISPNRITLWGLNAARPPAFMSKEFWPRQSEPSQKQKRLWRRFISSQFLRYGLYWRQSPCEKQSDTSFNKDDEQIPTREDIDFPELIKRLPRGQRRLLSYFRQLAPDATMWKACRGKRAITIASDGGLKGDLGTFGWQMRSSTDELLAEGAGPVDGPFDVANSTRCELGGYAASILFISLFSQLWGCRHTCRIRWVTDSKSAIAKVNSMQAQAQRRKQPDNADLLTLIRVGERCTRRKICKVWIKGHQSLNNAPAGGRRHNDIKSNNHADELATWYRESPGKRQSVEYTDHIPETNISISINGIRLVGQMESCIRYHINGYHLRRYLQTKHKWDDQTWNKIDAEAISVFHTRLAPKDQIAHTKFMFDQWHIGRKRMYVAKYGDSQIDLCPCCKRDFETTAHVLKCSDNPARAIGIKTLQKSLTFNDFHPALHEFKGKVMGWLTDEVWENNLAEYPLLFQSAIHQACLDQEAIGWESAMKGYLSAEWRQLFSIEIGTNTERQEGLGRQRIKTIVKSLNNFAMTLWKARNEVLHGVQEESAFKLRQEELDEIREMHSHPEKVLASDRHYCEQTLENITRRSPSSRRRWLRFMRMARARAKRDGQRQTVITAYFRKQSD